MYGKEISFFLNVILLVFEIMLVIFEFFERDVFFWIKRVWKEIFGYDVFVMIVVMSVLLNKNVESILGK